MEDKIVLSKKNLSSAIYILGLIEKLVDFNFENCTCPEEHEIWSDFREDYDYFLYSMIHTVNGYLKHDKK